MDTAIGTVYKPERVNLHNGWTGWIYREWKLPPELIRKWDSLSLTPGDTGIFISYGWFDLWWRAFGAGKQLFLVILKNAEDIKAIFPCCITAPAAGGSEGAAISSMTNTHTCYYSFLIEPSVLREALSGFLELLLKYAPHSQVRLEYLSEFRDTASTLTSELKHHKFPYYHHTQPWAPWTKCSGDWTAFHDNLPGRLKNTLRRYRKKAGTQGTLHFEAIERNEKLDDILNIVFDVEYNSWKGRNGTAVKCQAEVEQFYRQLAHWAMGRNHLLLFILYLDNSPIAADFCLSFGHTVFLLKPGYNESFHYISPGNLLRFEVFDYLYKKQELRTYDFLGACDAWKMEWTQTCNRYGSIKIYPKSLQGWGEYMFQYGWKDFLKKFRTARKVKSWLDRRGN